MIEKIVLDHLNAGDLGAEFYMETPVDAANTYGVIVKTGSSESNHIQSATIVIQSIAHTLLQAAEINEKVKSRMRQLPTHDAVFGCDLNSDYNFTNPQTKQYRYQAVFNISYKEG